jgi:hypothetical protein
MTLLLHDDESGLSAWLSFMVTWFWYSTSQYTEMRAQKLRQQLRAAIRECQLDNPLGDDTPVDEG